MSQFLVPPFVFLMGASLGSFLNVIILRRGKMQGRSACPHCSQELRWWELIPILSFIFLRARCARCRSSINWQYPAVELIMGISALILFTPLPVSAASYIAASVQFLLVAILVMLFVIDLKTMILPDILTLALTITAVISLLSANTLDLPSSSGIAAHILGAMIGSGFLLFLFLVTRGQGIGFGDVKLLIPLGLLFGAGQTVILLLFAFIAGGLLALFLLMVGRATRKTAIPFGPFLTGVAILFLLAPALPQYFIDIFFLT